MAQATDRVSAGPGDSSMGGGQNLAAVVAVQVHGKAELLELIGRNICSVVHATCLRWRDGITPAVIAINSSNSAFPCTCTATTAARFCPPPMELSPWTSTNPVPWLEPLCDYYRTTMCFVVRRCAVYTQSPYNYFMGSRAIYLNTGTFGASGFATSAIRRSIFSSGDCNYVLSTPRMPTLTIIRRNTLFAFQSPVHSHRVNILFADMHVRSHAKFGPPQK